MFKRLYEKILPRQKSHLFSNEQTQQDAQDAAKRANEAYDQTQVRKSEVSEVTASLRAQRERNQFAYLIERSMRGNG